MALNQHSTKDRIGFIGLGAMGGPMARSLLIGGQRVVGYDLDVEARTRFMESGGTLARTPEELVRATTVVFTSLPDSATFADVAETRLLPHSHNGQVFVDTGTVVPAQIRRLARMFARRGAVLLDAPVSGGPDGAEAGTLRLFVGGDLDTFNRVKPLLQIVGDKEHVSFCGPSGSGQVVKGVNQLAMGLVNAALLESVAYGVNAGITPDTLRELVGGEDGWRKMLADICTKVEKSEAEGVGIKVGQYAMFLLEAREKGFDLPICKGLLSYLAKAEPVIREANRMSPSFWRELTTGAAAKRAAARK